MTGSGPIGRRVLLIAAATGTIAGCGFEPIYGERTVRNPAPGAGPTASVRNDLGAIWIEPIPERAGQQLRNELIDMINGTNEPTQPKYRLEVRMRELKQPVLERKETLETATNLIVVATYRLKTPAGELLTANQSRSVVLYNQLASPYATVAAEEYARERAVRLLAEDIRLRVALFLANRQGA